MKRTAPEITNWLKANKAFLIPPGFGLRQPSAALEHQATPKAAEACRTPRRKRINANPDFRSLAFPRVSPPSPFLTFLLP
jgi:hypothetical protein